MQRWAKHNLAKDLRDFTTVLSAALALVIINIAQAGAVPQVQQRFDQISDSKPGAVSIHRFGFRYTDFTNSVGSVSFEFCSNSPIPEVVCDPPVGMDVSAASLTTQSGQTGFSINGSTTTTNKLVITRIPGVPSAFNATSRYVFENITNPTAEGSYYVRIETFASNDGSGISIEDGGVVFALIDQFSVSAEVPPYLELCAAVTITAYDCSTATSFFIDFGEFSRVTPRFASSEIVAATNASYGFSITLAGTTLTSGNNAIPALASRATSSPGSSQFGLNLHSNTNPSIGANVQGPGTAAVDPDYYAANQFKFLSGDTIVSTSTTSDSRKFTVSYIANINGTQKAGVYATTVSFIALANF